MPDAIVARPSISGCFPGYNHASHAGAKSLAHADAFIFHARNHQPERKRMSAYIIGQFKFTHRELYDRVEARLVSVFRKFSGRLLVADDQPQVLEGPFECDKVVVLEFPDKTAATAFRDSPEHAAIAADRKAGADAVILLVESAGPEKIRAIDVWPLTQAPH
jgi:uncharacterized protein (DUF1330 family)